jgi:hypothetical protein
VIELQTTAFLETLDPEQVLAICKILDREQQQQLFDLYKACMNKSDETLEVSP